MTLHQDPGAQYSPGRIKAWVISELSVRHGIPINRVAEAVVDETIDNDLAFTPNGKSLTVLINGSPVRDVSTERALGQLVNSLALRLSGREVAVAPRDVSELAKKQREAPGNPYTYG